MPKPYPSRKSPKATGRRFGVRSAEAPAERAVWDLTYDKPANLEALTGSEAIDNTEIEIDGSGNINGIGTGDGSGVLNTLVTIDADGTVKYDGTGSGQVTLGGLGAGALAVLDDITLSLVTDAGALASKDTIEVGDLDSGLGFIERGSGAPTASSTRVYQDTADGGVYSDDGASVVKISPTIMMPRLGTNTDFSSTSFEVVVQGELGTRLSSALLWVAQVYDAFQAPDSASDVTYEGQWILYLSDTSKSTGDDPFGLATENLTALWTGSVGGLTFSTPISAIEVASNDLDQNIYPTPKALGSTYAGAPAYLQLCLKRTAGSGAAKLSSAFGFDAYAVMG